MSWSNLNSVFAIGLLIMGLAACSDDSNATAEGAGGDAISGADGGDVSTDGLFTPTDTAEEASAEVGEDASEEVVFDLVTDQAEDDQGGSEDSGVEDSGTGEFPGRLEECGFGSAPCARPLECRDGRCHLPCDEGECPEDEVCSGSGRGGICGWTVGEGEDCDPDMATFCEGDLYCDESDNTCHAPEFSGVGEGCNGEEVMCEEGLVCYSTGFGGDAYCQTDCSEDPDVCGEDEVCIQQRREAVCLEACDPDTDPECSGLGYECRTSGGPEPQTACFPPQELPGDQAFGDVCDDENHCQAGLTCPPMIPGAYCTQECDSENPCPSDPARAECVDLMFVNYCLFSCDGGDDDCPEGMTCNDVFGTALCSW